MSTPYYGKATKNGVEIFNESKTSIFSPAMLHGTESLEFKLAISRFNYISAFLKFMSGPSLGEGAKHTPPPRKAEIWQRITKLL